MSELNDKIRVAVILGFPPTRDNIGWPSALPFYLMTNAPRDVEIDLFYFRGDEKHRARWERDIKQLRLRSVHELEPFWTRPEYWLGTWNKASRRGFPIQVDWFPVRRNTVKKIQACSPDVIWLYPHWLSRWIPELKAERIVVTGPDCAVLHSERALEAIASHQGDEIDKATISLRENLVLEQFLANTRADVHVVGKADAQRFNRLAGREVATFTTHPHFDYVPRLQSDRNEGRLRVLMSGDATSIYFSDHAQRIASSFVDAAARLVKQIDFTLIGRNWSATANTLAGAGYSVRTEIWVEDYGATLANHDVALCPYAVGAGTKGKVLQAMASGVLVVGSKLAFENVHAVSARHYIEYERPESVGSMIEEVTANWTEFEAIAQAGARTVQEAHSPHEASKEFWDFGFSQSRSGLTFNEHLAASAR